MLHTWLKWMVFFPPRKYMKYRLGKKNCDIFFASVRGIDKHVTFTISRIPNWSCSLRFLWESKYEAVISLALYFSFLLTNGHGLII